MGVRKEVEATTPEGYCSTQKGVEDPREGSSAEEPSVPEDQLHQWGESKRRPKVGRDEGKHEREVEHFERAGLVGLEPRLKTFYKEGLWEGGR